MGLILKEVLTKRDLIRFIKFPFELYKNNKCWIPPLISDEIKTLDKTKNPAFGHCDARYWIVENENKIVGRIAGIINHKYNEKFNARHLRFGWLDFIDDEQVVDMLFNAVESWAKEKGLDTIHGPLGFTDMDGEGLLIEGFDEVSTFGSIYNYDYYPKHLSRLNFEKDADWVEYLITLDKEIPEKISRISDIVMRREKLSLLEVRKSKDLLPYAYKIFYLINETYKNLYGFVELTDKQIDMYVKSYFSFIKPGFVPIVIDQNKELVAFGISMPSLSNAMKKAKGKLFPFGFLHLLKAMRENDTVDLYLTAVKSEYQNKGVNSIIIHEINKTLLKNKIYKVETNRELELNEKIQNQWRYYQNRQHKRRRCYIKKLI
ncbi:MAG: hypothetical protein Fur0015_02550 [Ignavibacteriales bacterium]